MNFEEYLTEAPQRIEPDEFNLNNIDKNREICKRLLKDYKLKLLSDDFKGGSKLYSTKREIFLENKGFILYYVKYEINQYKLVDKSVVTQTILWRKRGAGQNKDLMGLPTRLFFDVILEITGVVATDKQQTNNGEIFWYDRVSQSFEDNLYVYYLNVLYSQELRELKDFAEFEELINNEDVWGDSAKHQLRKVLISKYKL